MIIGLAASVTKYDGEGLEKGKIILLQQNTFFLLILTLSLISLSYHIFRSTKMCDQVMGLGLLTVTGRIEDAGY